MDAFPIVHVHCSIHNVDVILIQRAVVVMKCSQLCAAVWFCGRIVSKLGIFKPAVDVGVQVGCSIGLHEPAVPENLDPVSVSYGNR